MLGTAVRSFLPFYEMRRSRAASTNGLSLAATQQITVLDEHQRCDEVYGHGDDFELFAQMRDTVFTSQSLLADEGPPHPLATGQEDHVRDGSWTAKFGRGPA